MTIVDIKHLIRECVQETLAEIESESPTGMLAVNIAEAPPQQSAGAKYTELAKVVDYMDPQPLQLIKMKGPSAAIDYLVSQLNRYQPKQLPAPPWKSNDKTFDRGDYVLYWNETDNYVGLVKVDAEELQEMTGTGAVAGYATPYAFSKKGSGSARAIAASVGYKKVNNSKKNTTKK